MRNKIVASVVMGALLAGEAAAADLYIEQQGAGARRSAAVAGAYVRVPLGASRQVAQAPRAGLRLAMRHDYREALNPTGRVVEADAFDLRLVGEAKPSLFVAGHKVTGEGPRSHLLSGITTPILILIGAGLVVGGIALANAIDDSGGE